MKAIANIRLNINGKPKREQIKDAIHEMLNNNIPNIIIRNDCEWDFEIAEWEVSFRWEEDKLWKF